jgi:hypothetical protein
VSKLSPLASEAGCRPGRVHPGGDRLSLVLQLVRALSRLGNGRARPARRYAEPGAGLLALRAGGGEAVTTSAIIFLSFVTGLVAGAGLARAVWR